MGRKLLCTTRRAAAVSPSDDDDESGQPLQQSGVTQTEGLHGLVQERHEGMNKRNKTDSSSTPSQSMIEEIEYNLALDLLEFEKLGYLSKSDQIEDECYLLPYGDKFGLSTLSEYPTFFKKVPQHPHYEETSLDNVKASNAENYWDLFMPLVHRGLSAVRRSSNKEIAAVESRIARFTDQGFDLRHLKAYINTYHRLLANQASLKCKLEKVKCNIESEKARIEGIIAGNTVADSISELEAEKRRYQKIIDDIDSSLSEKRKLLDEEGIIRATHTSPAHEMLLKNKKDLERRILEVIDITNNLTAFVFEN